MGHFILMADIIDSRQHDNQLLISDFQQFTSQLNQLYKQHLLSPLTITLGDEFQGIANSFYHSIRLLMDAEELIIKEHYHFKLRYIINYGEIDTPINKEIAYGMLGSGLTEARERLAHLKKTDLRFSINGNMDELDKQLMYAFEIYQTFVDDWKTRDFNLVKEFIDNKTFNEVSEATGLSFSSVWRRKKSLKINSYFAIKNLVLSLVKS